ncbi:MAG: cobalamin-dependent protein, partial [Planctomycetota bacterium]|nr:cobalamin-dependent protein [Planctomycetota bacterium]
MNHGFAMLSAVLKRAGQEPFLVDLRALNSWEHFEQVIGSAIYDFSLISFLSCDEAYARKATEIMKRIRPDKFIIGGGIHLSVTQCRSYPNIDSIVLGEGEAHILRITNDIMRGKAPKPVYELEMIQNLDDLPFV